MLRFLRRIFGRGNGGESASEEHRWSVIHNPAVTKPEVLPYFRARFKCGCVFVRLKGFDPCARHATDFFFQTATVVAMTKAARWMDRMDGINRAYAPQTWGR